MAHSYSNLQFKTGDSAAVRNAIDLCDAGSAKMLARAESSWIGVYPFLTEDDFAFLKMLGERMSAQLSVPAFGFIVPRPDVFRYALFQGGRLLDQYSSDSPDTNENRVDLLLPLCTKGTGKARLTELFKIEADDNTGDRMAQQFAQVLGIPRAQMLLGYNHLKWAQAGR